jgi:hypothetical protein
MATVFALRHQRAGIVPGPLFSAYPSFVRVAVEKARLDMIYGPGWLRVVPVALELAPEHADLAERFASPPEPPPPPEPVDPRAIPHLSFRATGIVAPPR